MTRLRFRISLAVAVVSLLAFATAFALVGTTAVSAAMPGRVGAPDVTIPLAHRVDANEPLYRIAALGDVGTGAADEYAVASQVAAVGEADPFDALVLLGDNVYPDGNPARLNATVFTPFGPVLESGAALLPVIGNHDQNYADEQVAALGMPGQWYATRLGDVLFIGLDSNLPEDPVQLAWLQSTLTESSAQWIIAAMHHPPFSAGVHGSDEDTRDTFVPLFEKYGVDLVLAGHDHDYQRSIAVGGVTYVVSGAGAKVRSTGSADFTAASAAVLHFVEIGIWEDRLELTAISLDGVHRLGSRDLAAQRRSVLLHAGVCGRQSGRANRGCINDVDSRRGCRHRVCNVLVRPVGDTQSEKCLYVVGEIDNAEHGDSGQEEPCRGVGGA